MYMVGSWCQLLMGKVSQLSTTAPPPPAMLQQAGWGISIAWRSQGSKMVETEAAKSLMAEAQNLYINLIGQEKSPD